jgi:hypothetical protein
MASLTDNPKQQNPKNIGCHWSKKDDENNVTSSLAQGKPGLTKVKAGRSISLQVAKVMKAITIYDYRESDEEQGQVSTRQPINKEPVVETNEDMLDKVKADEDDEDEDEKDQEDVICAISAGR